jgi:hypothetical protein
MSFGAMAGWQGLLLIGGAAAAAVWLFYIKVRPPRINVPSLLLWRRVLDHKRELTWWERVRKAVSLAVTIAVALALAIALTRPGPSASGAGARTGGVGRVLIVVDSSWSMAARSSKGGTRWARALADAHAIASASSSGEVALATTADGLVEAPTSDIALIDTAIDDLQPAGGDTNDFPRVAGASAVHFITDGAVARTIDPSVIVHSVFDAAPNVAVTALELRPAAAAGSAGEAYLEVANYAPNAQSVRLVLTRGAATVVDTSASMGPGEVARRSVPLDLEGDPELRARVSAPDNVMTEDDEADAWIGGASPILVAIVSDQPAMLSTLLQHVPNLRTAIVSPAQYRPGREDVAIFDRWLPDTAPKRPALVVAPPGAEWLGKVGAEERQPKWVGVSNHPVLAGVDAATIDIKRARSFEGGDIDVIARSETGTALLGVTDRPDRRAVVLTFGAADSNLAFAPAFPVLVANAIEWLARPIEGSTRRPGPIALTPGTTRVTAPDNSVVPLSRVGSSVSARLTQPGFYTIEAGGARSTVGVNIGSPEVSNLQHTSLGNRGAGVVVAGSGSSHAWWLYAVIAAFLLVAAEWWTWQRRITV